MTDETYNLSEEVTKNLLREVQNLDSGSKENRDLLEKAGHMLELIISADKENADYYDKSERRRIEEERIKVTNEIEHDKQKITWQRATLEMAKVIVPSLLTMIGYGVFQKRLMKFEETGRVSSTAGRELHLPHFMK